MKSVLNERKALYDKIQSRYSEDKRSPKGLFLLLNTIDFNNLEPADASVVLLLCSIKNTPKYRIQNIYKLLCENDLYGALGRLNLNPSIFISVLADFVDVSCKLDIDAQNSCMVVPSFVEGTPECGLYFEAIRLLVVERLKVFYD